MQRPETLDIARDVLDKPVIDRDGRPMGRADSVTLTLPAGGPPRLDAVVIGPVALAHRAAPRLGVWMTALERWIGNGDRRPVVVPFDQIEFDGLDLKADVRAGDTSAMRLEEMLQRWLARLPGSQ